MNLPAFVLFALFAGVFDLALAMGADPQDSKRAVARVVVTANSTQLKVGNTVIAAANKGDRFAVLDEAPGWFYVQLESPLGPKLGWIPSEHVLWVHPVLVSIEDGRPREALNHAQSELTQLTGSLGDTHRTTIDALNRLGLAKLACGDADSAVDDFRRVWQAREQLDPNDSLGISEGMNNLAVAIFRSGNYAAAHPLLQRVMHMRNQALGAAHAESLRSVINLVNFEETVNSEMLDWELTSAALEEVQNKALSGELAGSPTSADLIQLREARIGHPSLKLTFNAANFQDEPRDKSTVRRTIDSAWWFTRLGLLTGADEHFDEAAEIYSTVFGLNHFQSALALANAAGKPKYPVLEPDLIPRDADPERAQQLESAIRVLEAYQDGNELHLATVHHNLGICLLSDPGSAVQARQHLQQALNTFQQQAVDHPRTGIAWETLGLAGYIVYDYEASVVQLSQAYEIERNAFGHNHTYTTASLNSLGAAYFQLDDFGQARGKLEKALALRQQALGMHHTHSIRSMNDLAVVLGSQGDLVGARNLFEKCIVALKQQESPDSWLVEQIETSLWVVRLQMGDYLPAQRYFESVLRSENTYAHRDALANLATLARLQGRLTDARRYLEQAISLFPDDLSLLNDLGAIVREQGDLERAAEILGQVVASRTQASFPDNTAIAFSLTSLALVEQRLKRFDSAKLRLIQALDHYRQEFGDQNPRTTEVLKFLGQTELLAGDLEGARKYLATALNNKLLLAETVLPSLSEAEALAYVVAFDERDLMLEASAEENDVQAAYEIVWQTRAIATRALSPRQHSTSSDPKTRLLQAQLAEARKALSKVMLASYESADIWFETDRVSLLQELGEQKERLERALAVAMQNEDIEPGWQLRPDATLQDLLDALPADVAVVDFLRVHRVLGQPGWHYEAFVMRSSKRNGTSPAVHRVSLGTAPEIDAAVVKLREMIIFKQASLNQADAAAPNQSALVEPAGLLRKLIWARLEPHLDGAKTLILVPDGSLTAVPWYALPAREPGKYLIEDYAIGTAAFPHHVLELLQPATNQATQVLLAGGIDYANKSDLANQASFKAAPTRGASWSLLPGTRNEVRTISGLSQSGAVLLEGTEANETRLMQEMPKSRFIHLATHGFFADPELLSSTLRKSTHDHLLTEIQMSADETRSQVVSNLDTIMGRNPLALSGVVLAGASSETKKNEYGAPIGEDGILTAEEVVSLDLRDTELIVLSACETGLGTVAGGEGVFGLQRSFALSGARATMSSLWKVDDAATAALMTEFYKNLWIAKMSKLEALRQAQLWMHREPSITNPNVARGVRVINNQPVGQAKQLPPFYWAAFVLSGDWQ